MSTYFQITEGRGTAIYCLIMPNPLFQRDQNMPALELVYIVTMDRPKGYMPGEDTCLMETA